jgi:ribonuclease HII
MASEKRSRSTVGLSKSYEKEIKVKNPSIRYVLGCDEAGRGPLAGPVVAAAVICLEDEEDDRIQAVDSKKLSEAKREEIYEILMTDTSRYVTGWARLDHGDIDRLNILRATMDAMTLSITECTNKLVALKQQQQHEEVGLSNIYGVVDGNKVPPRLPISTRPMVKGDALCHSVALASIVAKVTRDRIMKAYHEQYPHYNFAKHKGYPTREHLLNIDKYVFCSIASLLSFL